MSPKVASFTKFLVVRSCGRSSVHVRRPRWEIAYDTPQVYGLLQMCLYVSGKITRCDKCLCTNTTFVQHFTSMWKSMRVIRLRRPANCLWQMSHLCGRSPVCVSMCDLRLPWWVNCMWHTSHSCGLSPVCISMCVLRWPRKVNCLWQMSHFCDLCIG